MSEEKIETKVIINNLSVVCKILMVNCKQTCVDCLVDYLVEKKKKLDKMIMREGVNGINTRIHCQSVDSFGRGFSF